MSNKNAVGKDWANSVLQNGYQSDNRDPYTTYAKKWNKMTGEWETFKFELGKVEKRKIRFNDELRSAKTKG